MSAIGLLILQAIMFRFAHSQFGGAGGGPSTFGYDASSACSKPYSRHGRARLEKLPCDFRRQNWCTVAGNAYPWHAVRRFVQENQGLMRRMYGDERHINILKAELEKNDIELEYEDRYPRYPDDSRRFQYEDEYEFVNLDKDEKEKQEKHESKSWKEDSYRARGFTSRSFEEPTTERTRKYTESSVEYTRPHTRHTDSATSRSSPNPISFTESSLTSGTMSSAENLGTTKSSTSSVPSESTSPDDIATSTKRIETKGNDTSIPEKVASIAPAVTLADIARIKNSSFNEIPGQLERVKDDDFKDVTEIPIVPESIIDDDVSLEPGVTARSPTVSASASTIDRIDEVDLEEDFKEQLPVVQASPIGQQQQSQQQFRPRPEYKPTETKPETWSLEGQLFQDVAAKDHQDQPVLKLRGVNACPVKEEVVAPFWANNTRGEVLALLNLYPFEQYVHWEKCTHENKQMYCRDGCRCEQQYRLHRLLAYDPNNECRGIFSDWFKFPSCCVCRCYDLPVEFRVTSRSPRIQKQKLKFRSPGHGRG